MKEHHKYYESARNDGVLKRLGWTVHPELVLIAALAIFKLLIHLFTNTNYELHRDAYLYLALGEHPDFGYFSAPPFIALIAKTARFLLGDSVFAIRFFPALAGAISVVLVAYIVKEMGGKRWAIVIAGLSFILSPAFLRSNSLFQPVTFNQFFWLLSAYLIVRMINRQNPRYWLYLGLAWGLAFLNKYSIVFFAFSFLIGLLLVKERKLLASKYVFFGGIAGLLIILPNLFWQYQHAWPVFQHMAELYRNQFAHVTASEFLISQILMNSHALLIWTAGLIYVLFFAKGKPFRVFGWTFLLLIFLLVILRGKPYYTLGIYPVLFAAGGVLMEQLFSQRLRIVKPVIVAVMTISALFILPYSLPIFSPAEMVDYGRATKDYGFEGALRWEDGQIHELPQDYADMIGWQELGNLVIAAYQGLGESEKKNCTIYAENYGQAGAIMYYGKKAGLPEPISFSDNFLYWAPDSLNPTVFIYVNDNLGEDIQFLFGKIAEVGRVNNPYFRENGVRVYLCRDPHPEFNSFYRQRVQQLRNSF